MIYLDNAATTRAFESAVNVARVYDLENFYNPSALYNSALVVKNDLLVASQSIADRIGAKKEQLVFTSGATESNNYALECGHKNKKGSIVISGGEHASVYETAMKARSSGKNVIVIPLTNDGGVDEAKLLGAIDDSIALVSVIHCSNETGVVNDIVKLARQIKEKNEKVVFHSDGVQAFCKIGINLSETDIDLYSISAHKVGGLKGIGALYIRNGFYMHPYIIGGGQQNNRRSGTENVAGIMAMAAASVEYSCKAKHFDAKRYYDYVFSELLKNSSFVTINGFKKKNLGYILSLSFDGIKGEVLTHLLEEKGIIIGLGSACSSRVKQSRVLGQLGLSKKQLDGSIRVSFCPDNTMDEIKYATDEIIAAAKRLKDVVDG